ncbi:MAG TPA: flagellar hook-length control protein FliK, partial [Caulobacteraceae bacterium]|nr:flagellar hook-length control protein FliK [Caulobacteraceae bacterium]
PTSPAPADPGGGAAPGAAAAPATGQPNATPPATATLAPSAALLTLLAPGQLASTGAAAAQPAAAPGKSAKAVQIQTAVSAGATKAAAAITPIITASKSETAAADEAQTGGAPFPAPHDDDPGGAAAPVAQLAADNTGLGAQGASQTTLAAAPATAMGAPAPAALASAHGADITAQLAAQITSKVNAARTAFDFALEPQGLGRVDVSLKIDQQGQLSAVLSFDSPNAAAEAKSRAGDLQQALQQAGIDVGQSGLSFTSGGGQGAAGQGAAQSGFSQAPILADPLADVSPIASPSALGATSAGGLDITI